MPLLTIENLPGAVLEVPAGTTLLDALHGAGFDWMHACGARGRCTTCRVQIRADERLTCQARLLTGAVQGRAPKATQLPHQRYGD